MKIDVTVADVTALRPAARRAAVLDPDDNGAAQTWAGEVRISGRTAIRYPSVRDRPDGVCWALLASTAFRSAPRLMGTWLIRVTRESAQCRQTSDPFTSLWFSADQLLVHPASQRSGALSDVSAAALAEVERANAGEQRSRLEVEVHDGARVRPNERGGAGR